MLKTFLGANHIFSPVSVAVVGADYDVALCAKDICGFKQTLNQVRRSAIASLCHSIKLMRVNCDHLQGAFGLVPELEDSDVWLGSYGLPVQSSRGTIPMSARCQPSSNGQLDRSKTLPTNLISDLQL